MKEDVKITGIDLRDYFAGIAMGALINADPDGHRIHRTPDIDVFDEKKKVYVKKSYLFADAMLREREEAKQA